MRGRTRPGQAGARDTRPGGFPAAAVDLAVTLLLWAYFTAGFVVLFAPFYLLAIACARSPHLAFQRLNHYFYRGFFALCRLLVPRHALCVDESVAAARSCVIVCNHLSYIDPLLLISLYPRHTTIVKSRLFAIPVFGSMLRWSGYLPSSSAGKLAALMIRRLSTLPAELAGGSNLFVFPEGTRSRSGAIGPFNPGAFKIARMCRAPLKVVVIRNTDQLFTPDRFLFQTRAANTISVELVADVTPAYDSDQFSMKALIGQVRALMERALASGCAGPVKEVV